MKFLTGAAAATAGLVAGAAFGISPVSAAGNSCPPWDCVKQAAQDLGGDVSDAVKKSNPFICNDGRGCEDYSDFGDPVSPTSTSSHPAAKGYSYSGVSKRTCGPVKSRQYDYVEVPFAVTNNSGESIDVHWRNDEGSRIFYQTIDSGTADFTTYRGHAWEITDSDGDCVWQFVINSSASSAYLKF